MSTMTRRDAISIALDEEVTRIDAKARDMGHKPHAWNIDGPTATAYCQACGAGASVRVFPTDLRVWSAGRLKNDDPCPGKGGT